MPRFCYICGKPEKAEGLCEQCLSDKIILVEAPKKLEIKICPKCNSVLINNEWKELDLKKYFLRTFKTKGKIDDLKIELKEERGANRIYKLTFLGNPKDYKEKKEEEHEIKIHFNKMICKACAKISSGYYEAIIQLRGDVTPEMINFIENRFQESKGKMSFYRIEEFKNGINFYAADKILTQKVVAQFNKRFKVKIKASYKLVGMKDGRDLYRNIYSVKVI